MKLARGPFCFAVIVMTPATFVAVTPQCVRWLMASTAASAMFVGVSPDEKATSTNSSCTQMRAEPLPEALLVNVMVPVAFVPALSVTATA